jgi:hypothetical protein
MDILEREATAGFPRITGARVLAKVPIFEEALNDMLERVFTSANIRIEIRDSNHLVVRIPVVGGVPLTLPLEICLTPTPSLTLPAGEAVAGLALHGTLAGVPHVSVRGNSVSVDLRGMTPPAYGHLGFVRREAASRRPSLGRAA